MRIREFSTELASRLKVAYAVRNVDLTMPGLTLVDACAPRPGHILAARVDAIGHHNWLELASGRKAAIYPGDEILLAFGERYAPDQYESRVPEVLGTSVDLVAAGGVAGEVLSRHGDMRPPTRLEPIGVLADREGSPVRPAALQRARAVRARRPPARGLRRRHLHERREVHHRRLA